MTSCKQELPNTPAEKLVEQVEKVPFRNISPAAFRELMLRRVFETDGDDFQRLDELEEEDLI